MSDFILSGGLSHSVWELIGLVFIDYFSLLLSLLSVWFVHSAPTQTLFVIEERSGQECKISETLPEIGVPVRSEFGQVWYWYHRSALAATRMRVRLARYQIALTACSGLI